MPGSLATHGPTPPIGLAYVASALRNSGHIVQVIDGAGEGIDRCEEIVSPVGPLHRIGLPPAEIVSSIDDPVQVIGITNMFLHEWPQVRELARLARDRFPDVPIVVGGENATAFHERILRDCPMIDACVLGEGENTMRRIVDCIARGREIPVFPGVATRSPSQHLIHPGLPDRATKREIATASWPAWDLFPLEKYWSAEPFFGVNRGRSMQVLGTRGCPYKCSFCSSPQMWTTKFVVRDPKDLLDEIEHYVKAYGATNLNFVDLTAATNRRWTLSLCDEIERRAPGVTWQLPVGTRIESIDRTVLERLHDTGCRNITFAPESGSPRVLTAMGKQTDLARILSAVRDSRRVGLRSTVNIIVGHPSEGWRDLIASTVYLVKVAIAGGDDVAVIMFCPYPGSRDFDELVATGRHRVDERALYVGLSRSSSQHMSWNDVISARELRIAQIAMIALFYGLAFLRRPSRFLQFVMAQVTGRESTYLDQMVRTKRTAIRPARRSKWWTRRRYLAGRGQPEQFLEPGSVPPSIVPVDTRTGDRAF